MADNLSRISVNQSSSFTDSMCSSQNTMSSREELFDQGTPSVSHFVPKPLKWVTVVFSTVTILLTIAVGILVTLKMHPFSFKLLIHSMSLKNPITILLMSTAAMLLASLVASTMSIGTLFTKKKHS